MTTRVTTPIVAGFGYATKAYIDFDNQMNQMKVQLDDGSQSASQLKSQVEELGNHLKIWLKNMVWLVHLYVMV